MSDIILSSSQALPVPQPKMQVNIRPGTLDDVSNIDRLQKKYSKNLAFLPTKALQGKIGRNEVLVAEIVESGQETVENVSDAQLSTHSSRPTFAGYLIGQDKYFKRDEVGIIYHLAVEETKQRGFIGAALLKAQFERSAYGCKLYCCWCAQDLAANHFYESMGFVPLAFRAGSEKKQRIHIFWEKRIREGDTSTPWWFPSETKGGMMAADRLAFPIPPGKHWSDEMPIVPPKDTVQTVESRQLTVEKKKKTKEIEPVKKAAPVSISIGRMGARPMPVPVEQKEKRKREKPIDGAQGRLPKVKNNPEYVAKARELKDRWLEVVNADPTLLLPAGKYDLVRTSTSSVESQVGESASRKNDSLRLDDLPTRRLLEAA